MDSMWINNPDIPNTHVSYVSETKQTGHQKKNLTRSSKNVIRESLVDPDNILLPHLHIKLGLMKQFVKPLDKNSGCLKYLCETFSGLSEVKLKEGILLGHK